MLWLKIYASQCMFEFGEITVKLWSVVFAKIVVAHRDFAELIGNLNMHMHISYLSELFWNFSYINKNYSLFVKYYVFGSEYLLHFTCTNIWSSVLKKCFFSCLGSEMSVCCSRRDCHTCSGTVIFLYILRLCHSLKTVLLNCGLGRMVWACGRFFDK